MAENGTALIFDAGVELPPSALSNNMFVIPRRARVADETVTLDHTRTAAGFLQTSQLGKINYLPLLGSDIRAALEQARAEYAGALLVQSKLATMQTRQSMRLAARSIFGDAAQVITAELESAALVSALQLVARPAQTLSAFEVAALLSSLHRRIPAWFYAPYGDSRSPFARGNAVVERAQLNGDPDPFRMTLADEAAVIDSIASGLVTAISAPGQIVYMRHAGCFDVVDGVRIALAEKMGDAFGTLMIKSAESRSTALAARFGEKFVEVTLLEPTQALIDFTNDAAGLLRKT